MVKILELQSFLYVPAHRFVRLTGSSYPYTDVCRAAETYTAAHITVGYLPRAAAMLTIQTGQLMVRGLAPLRSDRLVGYSVRYSFIVVDSHHLLLAGLPAHSEHDPNWSWRACATVPRLYISKRPSVFALSGLSQLTQRKRRLATTLLA